eukprot:11784162-Ditylum_brightwellii.AAC.1
MERSKQNKHLVCNVDDDVDNGDNNSVDDGDDDDVEEGAEDDDVEDGVDNSDEDSVDDGVENGAEGANMHLAHHSQTADCCMMERSKHNKHLVCDEDNDIDNDVDNGDDDSVDDGDDDSVEEGSEGADKHLAPLSQEADCCIMERSKQNKHLVCDVEDDVEEYFNNGDDDSVDDGDDNGIEDGAEGADKHLAHLSQAAD